MSLVLLSVLLFAGRKICDMVFMTFAYSNEDVFLYPSGLGTEWEAPEEIYSIKEPNMQALFFNALISPRVLFNELGLVHDYYEYRYVNWINQYRVMEAKRLFIEAPERSMQSISQAVGFKTRTTFYKAFLRLYGKGPREYRKEIGSGE